MSQRIKVLITKPGIDGHWRGAIVVSTALRDAGMEVIFAGNQTPSEIAESALQEDVDVVGLSILSAVVERIFTHGGTNVYIQSKYGLGPGPHNSSVVSSW